MVLDFDTLLKVPPLTEGTLTAFLSIACIVTIYSSLSGSNPHGTYAV